MFTQQQSSAPITLRDTTDATLPPGLQPKLRISANPNKAGTNINISVRSSVPAVTTDAKGVKVAANVAVANATLTALQLAPVEVSRKAIENLGNYLVKHAAELAVGDIVGSPSSGSL